VGRALLDSLVEQVYQDLLVLPDKGGALVFLAQEDYRALSALLDQVDFLDLKGLRESQDLLDHEVLMASRERVDQMVHQVSNYRTYFMCI
jgi:hypothetical protein